MRIIAGQYRRRLLLASPGDVTRPITDRAKETLFERIEQRIVGKRVADVFAGTGTIGLEALSRGAQRVVLIEKDKVALDLLRQNVAALKCEAETLIWPADVFRCSFRPKGRKSDGFTPYETIFFDPPYKMVPAMKSGSPLWKALVRLARDDVSTPEATLVFRAPERARYDLPEQWEAEWTLEMSNMEIHICRRTSVSTTEEHFVTE
jgi:16S rRNA (guanine966-N2)-methyltransferase